MALVQRLMLLYLGVLRVVSHCALYLFPVLCHVSRGGSHRSCSSAEGLGLILGSACTPTLPYGSGGGWSRGSAQLGVLLGEPGRGWVLSSGCFSPVSV